MTTCAAAIRMPFPQACRILPAIIIPKFPAKMLRSSPIIKPPIPVRYSRFVGNRVMRKAVSGMIIPMAREYPLVTHWPTDVLIPKYSTTFGSAVVIAVDRVEEAMPETTRQIKIRLLFLSVSCMLS